MSPKRTGTKSGTGTQLPAQPFGGPVVWRRGERVVEVAADRTLESVLNRMLAQRAEWVVIVRPLPSGQVYYYAFRSGELDRLASEQPERRGWPIEQAVDMHEWTSSRTARRGRPLGTPEGTDGPAAGRIVELDAADHVATVGEREDMIAHAANGGGASDVVEIERHAIDPEDGFDLGPMRGGRTRGYAAPRAPSAPAAADLEITLSAEAPAEVGVGATVRVPFQIEVAGEAVPLAVSRPARAAKDVPIVVSLSSENDAVAIQRSSYTLAPPASGEPRTGFFSVKGVRPAVVRLAVTFRQGGSDLGVIGLVLEVVPAAASADKARGQVTAAPRDVADDDKLALIIEQRTEGNDLFYEYTLHSEALDLPFRRERSPRLLDSGGGPAATALKFVERIYGRVTRELKSLDDLKELQREARALGVSLGDELFHPNVSRVLWPLRARITLVQIVSFEPFIPWELVRLRDPDSDEIDDRFLCEYGLVRTMTDEAPVRTLSLAHWSYFGASFPMGSFPPVGPELEYFTKTSPDSLQGRGFTPTPIEGTRDAFYDALAKGDFDVLHIACHAESQHEAIDRASLILGDEKPPGSTETRLVEVDATSVSAEARLRERRPLVFLNGCETGRVGPVMTAWGGWPSVFLRRGAGAFVGSAWAVRDRPAAAFATAFYNTLLDGRSLAEAASAARAAAKKLGDASWLAFKVYGHPRARRAQR